MPFTRTSQIHPLRVTRRTLLITLWCSNDGNKCLTCRILREDCNAFVRSCKKFQEFNNLNHIPSQELQGIISPWPFAKWGMDILGPFPPGRGQTNFLIMAIDYFTKLIEAEAMTRITTQQVQTFVWRNIFCRFSIPHTMITNNG